MSDYKEKLEKAIQQALSSRAGNMLSIGRGYFPALTATGYMKKCPFCEKTGSKFSIRKSPAGHWTWGCMSTSCPASYDNLKANRMGDTIGLIATMEGCDRHKAIDKLLAMAGVENPKDRFREEEEKKAKQPEAKAPAKKTGKKADSPATPEEKPTITLEEPEDEGKVLSFFTEDKEEEEAEEAAPKVQVWNRMHQLLTLTPSDATRLRKERGYDDDTIRRAGFRSSNIKNRELLAPLLDEFPPSILLSNGIAYKDEETGNLKLNAQLCGYGLKKRGSKAEDDEWGTTNPILIPYRDKEGDITMMRPHKGGLSGKRYMREHGFELGFRSARTRTQLFTNSIFHKRPQGWENRAVLTEGEFKGEALAQCGIPAAAVPGIQMPRNEVFFEAMVERFRHAGIREVIVCFDNEDKSHKADPWVRHDAKVYALYACHALRAAGIRTLFLELPDEWRDESGKADWDGALARFGSGAAAKFTALIRKAKPYYPQTELFGASEAERIIHCKLNRLLHNPQILTGGEAEEELARLILRTPPEWRIAKDGRPPIAARELAKELFDTRGCYYIRKRPKEETLGRWYGLAGDIRKKLAATNHEDLDTIAGHEAALAAVNHIIEGRPDILTDFTISCEYQVRTQGGEIHRLFRFRNKHGQSSELITVPPSACSTSTKFREFCMGVGNYNPMIGDKHLQALMQDIGTVSAWREIRELEMLGRDPESNLWIFGDCAFTKDGEVLFADDSDIIWDNGIGYRIDPQDLEHFVHKTPPKFFKKLGMTPSECYRELTESPESLAREEEAVAQIFFQQDADFIASFGSHAGMLCIGNYLSYAAAPELLKKYNAHPGQWIHGRMSAGKTEMARFIMMSWGFDSDFRTQVSGGGTTAVSIDRFLAQYSDIPVNIDEFREKEADATRNGTLRACFNRQGKTKGRMDQTNKTRSVQPRTSPVVTGEGVTGDSATLSRYIELVLAKDRRIGTPEEQARRYNRMCVDQYQYHRIMRYVMMNRAWFAGEVLKTLEEWLKSEDVIAGIAQDRLRLTHGIAYAAFMVLSNKLTPALMRAEERERKISKDDLIIIKSYGEDFRSEAITYASKANSDVASINFVIKFWQNVVTCLGGEGYMKRFIRFERCLISETNRVTPLAGKSDTLGSVRCVIVRYNELYAEYEKVMAQRRVTPDLSLEGIRGEIRRENYWVPAPTDLKNKAHRLSIWGEGEGQKSCWVLRCDKMEPALEQVFTDHFGDDDQQENLRL